MQAAEQPCHPEHDRAVMLRCAQHLDTHRDRPFAARRRDNQANISPSIVGAGLAPALVLPAQIVNPRILTHGTPGANLFSMLFEVVPDRTTRPGPYIAIPLFRL